MPKTVQNIPCLVVCRGSLMAIINSENINHSELTPFQSIFQGLNRLNITRQRVYVFILGQARFRQVSKHRVLARLLICHGTLSCSKALLRASKPAYAALARMPAFAELHNENTADEPVSKSQKIDVISTLQVKLLSAAATLPRRGSAKAAGYDLARSACS